MTESCEGPLAPRPSKRCLGRGPSPRFALQALPRDLRRGEGVLFAAERAVEATSCCVVRTAAGRNGPSGARSPGSQNRVCAGPMFVEREAGIGSRHSVVRTSRIVTDSGSGGGMEAVCQARTLDGPLNAGDRSAIAVNGPATRADVQTRSCTPASTSTAALTPPDSTHHGVPS